MFVTAAMTHQGAVDTFNTDRDRPLSPPSVIGFAGHSELNIF